MKKITVSSNTKQYEVQFVDQLDQLISHLLEVPDALVVFDQQVAQLYPNLKSRLENQSPVLAMEATEETKTLSGLEKVLQFMQEHNATKSTTLIALGGGIVQDIVSFAAHIYYRGVRFVFVPTTLLAMSDSCIGGKGGINFQGFKNQIGAFHAPDHVFIWTGFIDSLTDEAIFSGYGEILKIMMIGDEAYYQDVKNVLNCEGFKNSKTPDYIFKGLEIKKRFVKEDEFDAGVRRILNYGHTFGHALELATHYRIPHGIAVAHGIDIANYIACHMGLLQENLYHEIHQLIETHFNRDFRSTIIADELLAHTQRDKKNTNGKLNMVLLEKIGKLDIYPVQFDHHLKAWLRDYLLN